MTLCRILTLTESPTLYRKQESFLNVFLVSIMTTLFALCNKISGNSNTDPLVTRFTINNKASFLLIIQSYALRFPSILTDSATDTVFLLIGISVHNSIHAEHILW